MLTARAFPASLQIVAHVWGQWEPQEGEGVALHGAWLCSRGGI